MEEVPPKHRKLPSTSWRTIRSSDRISSGILKRLIWLPGFKALWTPDDLSIVLAADDKLQMKKLIKRWSTKPGVKLNLEKTVTLDFGYLQREGDPRSKPNPYGKVKYLGMMIVPSLNT